MNCILCKDKVPKGIQATKFIVVVNDTALSKQFFSLCDKCFYYFIYYIKGDYQFLEEITENELVIGKILQE